MNKGLIALALVLVATASTMAVQRWQQRRQMANRVKAYSCLSQVGKALLLYQNANPPATQAVIPTSGPGHEPVGQSVLYADAPDVNGSGWLDAAQRDSIYAVATQPATRLAFSAARGPMILGCSKNHDQDGQNVLYADGHAEFMCAPLAALLSSWGPFDAPATQPAVDLWADLQVGGCVVLLRHAKTLGSGSDLAHFKIDDRSTQRNLSDEGVAQSKAVGEAFRRGGIEVGQVLSSQYFRCRETAEHAFGKTATDVSLNSLDSEEQLKQMRRLLESKPAVGNTVLVTHQANLKALTNIIPPMGDAVVIRPNGDGSFRVLGELKIGLP